MFAPDRTSPLPGTRPVPYFGWVGRVYASRSGYCWMVDAGTVAVPAYPAGMASGLAGRDYPGNGPRGEEPGGTGWPA